MISIESIKTHNTNNNTNIIVVYKISERVSLRLVYGDDDIVTPDVCIESDRDCFISAYNIRACRDRDYNLKKDNGWKVVLSTTSYGDIEIDDFERFLDSQRMMFESAKKIERLLNHLPTREQIAGLICLD